MTSATVLEKPVSKNQRRYLEEKARAILELKRRYEENPLLTYRPCCVVHGGRKPDNLRADEKWVPKPCPSFPCPESKHHAFHSSEARIRFILGGNRSAKTFTGNKEFLMLMSFKKHPFTQKVLNPQGRHGRVLAQDFAIHEKKHIPEIFEWIPKGILAYGKAYASKREAWDKSYDTRTHVLHLVNGGWIDFLTYDQDPSKGESVDLDAWFADEEIPEEWFSACNSRLITRNGRGILGVTPLYGLSWSMRLLDNPDPNVGIFKLSIWDNPYNTQKSIDDFIAQIPEHEKEARIEGTLIDFKGLRFKQLNPSVHMIESRDPQPGWPVICTVDPHQRKGTYVLWSFVSPNDEVIFFDELLIFGTVKDAVRSILEREKSHKARTMLRIIDPAADKQAQGYGTDHTTLDEFNREGMNFSLADNSNVGYSIVDEYLNYDVTKAISALNRPSAYFTRDVPKTWYSMTHLMWDDWKLGQRFQRDPKERIKDKDKDWADTVRYTLAIRPQFSAQTMEPVDIQMAVNF